MFHRILSFLGSFALVCVFTAPAAAQWKPGQSFPEIDFPTADGSALHSVAAYQGKPLLLHIYASW